MKRALGGIVETLRNGIRRFDVVLRGRMSATSQAGRSSVDAFERSDRRAALPIADAEGHAAHQARSHDSAAFAAVVSGPDPKPIDATLVELADDVGSPSPSASPIDGFVRLSSAELTAAGTPADLGRESGLRFAVYRNQSGHAVLAFGGTDGFSWKSWRANLSQGMGFETLQYMEAGRIGKMMKLAFGEDLAITGHSLGGGLATFAALKSGTPAVTFNAAGLSDQTIARLSLDPVAVRAHADMTFRNFVCTTDPLTNLQHSRLPVRVSVAAAVGGVVGSSVGAALGLATSWSIGQLAGGATGHRAGGVIGAAVAGTSAAAVAGGGFAQVRPALGHQIVLPDPHPPADPNLRARVVHAVAIHRIGAIRAALEQTRPWMVEGI